MSTEGNSPPPREPRRKKNSLIDFEALEAAQEAKWQAQAERDELAQAQLAEAKRSRILARWSLIVAIAALLVAALAFVVTIV